MNRRNADGAGRDEAPIVLYSTPDGAVKVNVVFRDGNLWLPQAGIAELFGVQKSAVSKHLKNIFAEGELDEGAVVSKMETTAADGKKYSVAYYGIKAIIAVGYRVNSERATAFRIWATNTLEEFVRKGFVLYPMKYNRHNVCEEAARRGRSAARRRRLQFGGVNHNF
ncbi:MAG: virulence RhuM family protein [Kiritimatiellae bacterium]|nr:virulence RhuM family protein [Kiritimatiellia bacterium]